jgi:hypothetical protein
MHHADEDQLMRNPGQPMEVVDSDQARVRKWLGPPRRASGSPSEALQSHPTPAHPAAFDSNQGSPYHHYALTYTWCFEAL